MNRNRLLQSFLCYALVALFSLGTSLTASAYKLTFFYDPATGNVSFDTAETRSGEIISYLLRIRPENTTIRFRSENHISLTGSALIRSIPEAVEETSFSPMRGLLTIGNVLPTGLTEETWLSLFASSTGYSNYSPGFGLPPNENREFSYGLPDRDFDNRWDIVDPNTLDWASEAKLIYQEASGQLLLDTRGTNSGHISGFLLETDTGFTFNHENFTPPWDSLIQTNIPERLSLLGNAIEPGLYSLGNVLAAGLSESAFEDHFSQAIFLGQAGFTGDLDFETGGQTFAMVYAPIPEPNSAILITIAGTLLLNARRKCIIHSDSTQINARNHTTQLVECVK